VVAAPDARNAPNTKAGGPTDDDSDSDEAALLLIHKRLTAEKKEVSTLRKRLAGTIRWGLKLKKELLDKEQASVKEKSQAKEEFAKRARLAKAALERAHKREMALSVNLRNATQAAMLRGKALQRLRQSVGSLQKDRASLHYRLAAVANETLALRRRLGREVANEADLRQKLADTSKELATHLKFEARERKADQLDKQKIAQKAAMLEKIKKEIEKTSGAKIREDATLNATRRELKASWEAAKKQKEAQRKQDERVRELLAKEKEAEERAMLLSQELEVQKKAAAIETAHEQQMGQLVNALRENVRKEVANLTFRLGVTEASAKELEKDNERVRELLKANTTRSNHLQTEVQLLKKRVEDGDKARQRAERAASKAQEEKVAAEAISKQLSGTVPRLLEQTQLAKEARDAEKAMRAQAQEAQVAARKEVAGMEQQYTSAVQGQLEQINQVLPQLDLPTQGSAPGSSQGAAAGGSASSSSDALEGDMDPSLLALGNDTAMLNEVPEPVTEDLADAVGRAAAATSLEEQPSEVRAGHLRRAATQSTRQPAQSAQAAPDLARDSEGLGSLLSQDEESD
jgi:hypothetical protein